MRQKRKKVEWSDYGPVRIWAGEHKGKCGYYDDEEGKLAVVYLGEPFASECLLIQFRWLEPVDSFEPLDAWKRENPEVAKCAGIP